jgi:low affinity Fe/Cu permease
LSVPRISFGREFASRSKIIAEHKNLALIGIEHLTQDEISDIADKCLARAKKAGNGMQRKANKKAEAAISKTV